jgi:two-component system phosphate regulon sensor histidine kinase PhoR
MWRSRMFWRLFGTFGVLLLASITFLGIVVLNRVEEYFLQQIEDSLRIKAVLVREALAKMPPGQSLQERIMAMRPNVAMRITLIAKNGDVLADSEEDPKRMEKHDTRPEVLASQRADFGTATRFSTTVRQSMMYVALRTVPPLDLPPTLGGDKEGGIAYVRVALPLSRIEEQLAHLRQLVWTAAAVTALAAMALAFWLARRMTQPLQELTQGAERIAAGNYGHKVYTGTPDEIGVLARSFNQMSEHLAAQFAQVEEDRRQLRAILSGMIEGVVALDADQRILFANDRAAQLLEFQAQPAIGRRFYEVVRQRALHEIIRRALTDPEPFREELSWNGRSAKNLMVHGTGLAGSPTQGAVLVFHDTSHLRRLERLRQEFVANVSHELKTPLSVIKACVETLLGGAIDDPQHRRPFLDQIANQADRLHALILDLLSLARIEAGTEAFSFQQVDVEEAVQACIARHRALAEGKNQSLETVAPAEKATAWADEEALGQILDNLVDNGIKYTPPGGSVRISWHTENDEVCLQVQDTGIGIPEPDLQRIFERFYRVDKARSRELGGTGLGLSIVKHLAQAMQGSVRAESQIGKGTTFSLYLPRSAGQ